VPAHEFGHLAGAHGRFRAEGPVCLPETRSTRVRSSPFAEEFALDAELGVGAATCPLSTSASEAARTGDMDTPHPAAPARTPPLFAYPFRVFFLSTALLAVLIIPAWLLVLLGGFAPQLVLPALLWHQHEMIFGFLEAAIAGFLLTAVCVWTSTDRLHGAPLAALWAVWLAGRLAMLFGGALPAALVHGVDLAFLPLVVLDAGRRIVAAKQHRQLVIVGVLGALWLLDVGFHATQRPAFSRAAMLAVVALMLVVGGRITPAFSSNWLRGTGGDAAAVRIVPWLETVAIGATVALLPLVSFEAPPALTAPIAAVAAAASAARLYLWRGWLVRREPLLWILHVALAWIPVALVLLAAAAVGAVAPTALLHAAGAGAAGALVLGVMSRVALGHTGRPLHLPPGMTLAFAAVLGAGALRVATALAWMPQTSGLLASGVLWVLAYGTFVTRYAPMLAAPRPDGRSG